MDKDTKIVAAVAVGALLVGLFMLKKGSDELAGGEQLFRVVVYEAESGAWHYGVYPKVGSTLIHTDGPFKDQATAQAAGQAYIDTNLAPQG